MTPTEHAEAIARTMGRSLSRSEMSTQAAIIAKVEAAMVDAARLGIEAGAGAADKARFADGEGWTPTAVARAIRALDPAAIVRGDG